jgi:hypothetical protein
MKKIMVMMTVALMVFSTNMFAQTATGDAKVATEKRKRLKPFLFPQKNQQ